MARRSAFRNLLEAMAAQAVVLSMQYSPRPLAERLGRFYAGLLDRAIPRLRRTAEVNLRFAYPDRDEAWRRGIIDENFVNIGRILFTMARFPQINAGNVDDWIRYEGFESYTQAKQNRRGVLFATAHLGNWELSAFSHALLTEPMNVVVRPLDNPLIDEMVEARRGLSGNKLLSKRDFARSILHALRRNDPVGILVDQNSAPENAVFVPFFGKLACTNMTFARLAARSGASVIPGFAVWSAAESKYILRFYPLLEMSGDPEEDTRRIQASIETAIREYPGQWLWIHRRWKTRPEGEPSLY